jgi:hypothetical protein
MDKPALSEYHAAVAWLILGYLLSHPDAKDTVDGVEKWWLKGKDISMEARAVQGALDHLVKLGWLVSSERMGTGAVYGLNGDHREKLWQFLHSTSDLR